jgi:hypothetical protein
VIPSGATTDEPSTRTPIAASEPWYPKGRAAPRDGTSCRPVSPSPVEFDAARQWRASRFGRIDEPHSIDGARIGVAVAVLVLHGLLGALWMREMHPPGGTETRPVGPVDTVMVVRLDEPPPPRPPALPEAPRPRPASSPSPVTPPSPPIASAGTDTTFATASASTTADPLAARLWQAPIDTQTPASEPRAFGQPSGPSVAQLLDRPAELPGRSSRLDQVWAPEGESLAGEFVRRTTAVREFKNRWGGRFRCAISPVTFGLPVCAFGIAAEPLPNAPLAPNEAPRDGRLPLGAPRP